MLQLLNMLKLEELVRDDDYEELLDDIRQECLRYGNVLSLVVPRPMLDAEGKIDLNAPVDGLGRVRMECFSIP